MSLEVSGSGFKGLSLHLSVLWYEIYGGLGLALGFFSDGLEESKVENIYSII